MYRKKEFGLGNWIYGRYAKKGILLPGDGETYCLTIGRENISSTIITISTINDVDCEKREGKENKVDEIHM